MLPKSNNDGTRHVHAERNFRSRLKSRSSCDKNVEQRPRDRIARIVTFDSRSTPLFLSYNIFHKRNYPRCPKSNDGWIQARDIPPRFFRFSLEKGLGGVGRNLVKSWPRCPSIEGRRRRISRAGVRESSVSLRRDRNNLLNYRMPKVTTLRDERLASGEEYYTRGGWGRGRAGETEWWCVNGIFRGITHARATLYH